MDLYRPINRLLNKRIIEQKVFCVGLHKTGTTTLAKFFYRFGFATSHSSHWVNREAVLDNYDFFSDGGSHFDDQHEFDLEYLESRYPDARFVLQTRSTWPWITSKLIHAGWDERTLLEKDDPEKLHHHEWRYKSLLTVRKLIEHKYRYENKVMSYFKGRAPGKFIVIDITDKNKQSREVDRLIDFCKLRSINKVSLPHSNRKMAAKKLSEQVENFIQKTIRDVEK